MFWKRTENKRGTINNLNIKKMNTINENQSVANSQDESMAINAGAAAMVAGENNTNSNNSEIMENSNNNTMENSAVKSNEMEKEVAEVKTIEQLRQEAEDAKKAVEENTDGKKTHQKTREVSLRKAIKALKIWFEKQTMPTLPVQFWRTESDEKEALMIAKETAEIIIAVSGYNLQTKSAVVNIAADCLTDQYFEYDAPKYVTPANLFYSNGIELKDLNGNIIPKNTPNVYVPVGGAATHAVFCAAHKLNIEAEVNNTPKIILSNVRVKNLTTMQELGKYIGNNTVLDRALNSKEQTGVAALATEHELMQKVFALSIEKELPKSTAFKYCALGARLTSKQWKEATRGNMPKDIKYDLTAGERTVGILINKGLEELIKSRYLIDAITKFANQPQDNSEELNGFELALQYLEQLTSYEVERLIETQTDKTDMLFSFLSKKQALTSQQAA